MRKTKILIGVVDNHPMAHKAFMSSLLGVVRHFDGWAFERRTPEQEYILDVAIAENGGVAEMRNTIAETALAGGYEYIFWMDSDQTFPENTLPTLLMYCERDGYEAASGLYTFKIPPFLPHIYPKLHEETGKFHVFRSFPLDNPIVIEGAGFGCLLMKTSVFARVPEPFFTMTYECGKMVKGEDLTFCRQAKMRMVLDPSIQCGHLRTSEFGIQDFIRHNGLKVEDGWIKPTTEQMNQIFSEQKALSAAKN